MKWGGNEELGEKSVIKVEEVFQEKLSLKVYENISNPSQNFFSALMNVRVTGLTFNFQFLCLYGMLFLKIVCTLLRNMMESGFCSIYEITVRGHFQQRTDEDSQGLVDPVLKTFLALVAVWAQLWDVGAVLISIGACRADTETRSLASQMPLFGEQMCCSDQVMRGAGYWFSIWWKITCREDMLLDLHWCKKS